MTPEKSFSRVWFQDEEGCAPFYTSQAWGSLGEKIAVRVTVPLSIEVMVQEPVTAHDGEVWAPSGFGPNGEIVGFSNLSPKIRPIPEGKTMDEPWSIPMVTVTANAPGYSVVFKDFYTAMTFHGDLAYYTLCFENPRGLQACRTFILGSLKTLPLQLHTFFPIPDPVTGRYPKEYYSDDESSTYEEPTYEEPTYEEPTSDEVVTDESALVETTFDMTEDGWVGWGVQGMTRAGWDGEDAEEEWRHAAHRHMPRGSDGVHSDDMRKVLHLRLDVFGALKDALNGLFRV
ncbi:unnamed protein product [Boreogadus saida]